MGKPRPREEELLVQGHNREKEVELRFEPRLRTSALSFFPHHLWVCVPPECDLLKEREVPDSSVMGPGM